jgi:hypothetical protein
MKVGPIASRKQAERDRERAAEAAKDHGALLPCGFCGGRHEPGKCEDPREHDNG